MTNCEFPKENASNEEIKEILKTTKTIAIVGISDDPTKASNSVAKYLINTGYEVIPINPKYEEILGLKCYPDLKSIPVKIDMVDVFRKPDVLESVINEAINIKPKTIWLQLGLCNNEAAEKARSHGIKVVMNKCTKIEHMNL
ncbi:MAG: CoA-binding protein [bacterium]